MRVWLSSVSSPKKAERNFEGKAEQEWYMPTSYVTELRSMTARPNIKVWAAEVDDGFRVGVMKPFLQGANDVGTWGM